MVIAGIDPGSRVTGYGLIRVWSNRIACLAHGVISTSTRGNGSELPVRLDRIHSQLDRLLSEFSPTVVAVEEVFHAANVRSALLLGHARGVVLLASAQHGIPVVEYSALEIKKAIVGYGRADKVQMQRMVTLLLNLEQPPQHHDASDALGIALCHAFRMPGSIRVLAGKWQGRA